MADIDQEDVYGGLGRADHIFGWCDELDDGMVELGTCPSIARLVAHLVPVK